MVTTHVLAYTAELTKALVKKRPTTHTMSFTFGTSALTTRYGMYDGFWNIRLWNYKSTSDSKKNILGGGIRNPYFMMGTYRANGSHRIFYDISNMNSWSSIPRQAFTWTLASPSYTSNIGIRVSYDPIALWITNDQDKKTLGAALGYRFSFWEPRIIYQYGSRARLPLDKTTWNSWRLDRPPAIRIHQLGTSQKFFLGRHIRINGTVVASTTDVSSPHMAGYGILSFLSTYLDITLKGGGSDKKYVNTKWKYSKYIWDQSTEITVTYAPYSYIRYRHNIAEYNPLRSEWKKNMWLDQYYEIIWQHLFIFNNDKGNKHQEHSMQPKITYKRNIRSRLHQIETEYIWQYKTWKLQGNLQEYLYEHKKDGTIEAHQHSLRIRFEYRIPFHALTVSAQIKADTIKIFPDTAPPPLKDIIKKWKLSIKYSMRIGNLTFLAGQYYTINKHNNGTQNLDLTLDFTIRYTIR